MATITIPGSMVRSEAPSGGRTIVPAKYRQDAIEIALDGIAQGKQLANICALRDMPPAHMMAQWFTRDAEIRGKYLQALEARVLVSASEMLSIADDGVDLARDKERIKVRIWLLENLLRDDFHKRSHATTENANLNVTVTDGKTLSELIRGGELSAETAEQYRRMSDPVADTGRVLDAVVVRDGSD